MLTVRLDPFQTRAFYLLKPGRIVVLGMGRGTGKTYLDRAFIHTLAFKHPGIKIGLLMPTLKQAGDVFWPDLLGDYYGPLRGLVHPPNLTKLTCSYKNGSRLSTWGAENANSIRGQRFGAVVEDECDDIDPDIERAVVRPTFTKSGKTAYWLKSGTPRRGRYGGLYRDFMLGQADSRERKKYLDEGGNPERYRSFRCRSSESPQVDQTWLSEERMALYSEGRGPIYEREYNCNFDSAEGLVYPHFDHAKHVRIPHAATVWNEILVGVDHGFNDPAVKLVVGVAGSGRDAICHAIEEVYVSGKTVDELRPFAVSIQRRYPNARFYADPSRPDAIETYRRAGCRIEPALNALEDGVSAVADRFALRTRPDGAEHARLYISPNCTNTIAEIGKYRRKRDPKNSERILDEIVDKDNHAMDALRYAIFSRFGAPARGRNEAHHEDRQV